MRVPARILFLVIVGLTCAGPARAGGEAPANEISSAEHYLEKLERHVERAGGKPFSLSYDDNEALKRVRTLKEAYPDDRTVEALFQRARAGLMASKGEHRTITPEMLAYREQERVLVEKLAGAAAKEWGALESKLDAAGERIEKPFPAPDPLYSDPEAMVGKAVVLEDFRYPDNEFTEVGGQFVFVGSQTTGFYFVRLTSRAWLGAYEALKRYRLGVGTDVPAPWTLVGEVTGVNLLVPEAGEEKTMQAWFGWVVEPRAIWVDGHVLAYADPERDLGGTFAGEDDLETLKQGFYTVKEVPEDVDPLRLVEILATAIKERNYLLYLDCIDPARKVTPKAIQRLRYFYDNNLERYRRFYVYVEPYELVGIDVIRGWRVEEGSNEDFFLDDEQKKKLKEHSEEVVEQAVVMIRTYDEHGKQSAYPKQVVLRRTEGGRWHVYSGYPL